MERFRLTPPRIKLTENDVERECLDLLRARGYYPLRLQSGVFRTLYDNRPLRVGEPGLPDYIAVHPAYPAFFLEAKSSGGKLSPRQRDKIRELELGWQLKTAVVDCVEKLINWLNEHQ